MSEWIRSLIRELLPAGGATRVRSFDRGGTICRNRPINEVAFHDPLHDAEHDFWMAWTINYRECTVKECINEPTRCFPMCRLRRTNYDHRRWCIEAAQKLQDAGAGRFATADGTVIKRKRKINHRDVNRDAANQIRCFDARPRLNDIHAVCTEDLGDGRRPRVFTPTTGCQEDIHQRRPLRTHAIAAAAKGGVVGWLRVEESKAHAQGG